MAPRRSDDPAAVPQSPGGADLAVGLAVDAKSLETGYAGLRRGGRLVLVALQAGFGGQDGAHV